MRVLVHVAKCIDAVPFAQKVVANVDNNVHKSFVASSVKEEHM